MLFNNPRGTQAVAISSAFTGLSTIAVVLRLYTRFFLIKCPGLEDYMILIAMLSCIGLTVCIALQALWGMGQHVYEIDPRNTVRSLQAFYASLILYNMALSLTKTSILLQYLRVFTTKWFKITCWSVMGFVVGFTFWTVLGSVFFCIPVRAFWTKEPGAKCISQFASFFTNAGVNILQDILIIALPMPVIRGLNLSRRQRGALIGIFAVGGFVCIVSIMRLQSLVAISNSTDPTYDNAPAATWSSVECNVGIICSCLPLMRPLVIRWLPSVISTLKRSADSNPRHYSSIGNSGPRRKASLKDVYPLETTRGVQDFNEDIRDIEVRTDIQVHVEGNQGKANGWTSKGSSEDYGEAGSNKDVRRSNSSTESLVNEPGHIV
ncbi:hypothetical protein ACN47E_009456 [Coniothyrium glycines]